MVSVLDNDQLMIINKSGITIRMSVSELREMGRATQGVRLISLKENDKIAAITKVQEKALNGEDEDNGETPENESHAPGDQTEN